MNSIKNAKIYLLLSTNLRFYDSKTILTPKMVLPHHAGKFLPKTKGFFPHDFTLIASVVGESVIGHGNGIGYICEFVYTNSYMARLANARRWSKR